MVDFFNYFYNDINYLKMNKNNQLFNDRHFYKYFETFVLKLLEDILSKENKILIKYPTIDEFKHSENKFIMHEFDAIAPDGISELAGPTLIEIKSSISNKSILNIARNYRESNNEFNSYLFIVGTPLGKNDKQFLKNEFFKNQADNNHTIEIWDWEKIMELASESDDFSKSILKNIDKEVFDLTIESAKKASNDWRIERDIRVDKLKQTYINDDIVFMIGAGVSKDAGVPNWGELLKDLNLSIINQKISTKLTDDEKN